MEDDEGAQHCNNLFRESAYFLQQTFIMCLEQIGHQLGMSVNDHSRRSRGTLPLKLMYLV